MLSKVQADIVSQALTPETLSSQEFGSSVEITVDNEIITIHCYSKRTTTLRALVNSYLRWIIMLKNTLDLLDTVDST